MLCRIGSIVYDDAFRLLSENRDRLDSLAEALVREETLDQPQAYAAAGLTAPGDGVPAAAAVAPAASSAT